MHVHIRALWQGVWSSGRGNFKLKASQKGTVNMYIMYYIVVHDLSALWQGAWSSGCDTHIPLPVCPAVPVGGTSSVAVRVLTRFHPGQTR